MKNRSRSSRRKLIRRCRRIGIGSRRRSRSRNSRLKRTMWERRIRIYSSSGSRIGKSRSRSRGGRRSEEQGKVQETGQKQ